MNMSKKITLHEVETELGISVLSEESHAGERSSSNGEVWYADIVHGGHWKSTMSTLRRLAVLSLARKGIERTT